MSLFLFGCLSGEMIWYINNSDKIIEIQSPGIHFRTDYLVVEKLFFYVQQSGNTKVVLLHWSLVVTGSVN